MSDRPSSPAGAVLLAGTLELTPAANSILEPRVPAIRRVLPATTPPLDLSVIPFRYRVRGDLVEAIKPKCRHERRRSRPRSS